MWPLNLLRTRHWVLLGVSVLFLLTYSGFISWGKVEQALEYLADQPAVRQRFATPIGRGEAIVTSFMFVLLTPLAVAAAGGIIGFIGAIGAGAIRMFMPLRDLPDWVFLGVSYTGIGIGIWLLRDWWLEPVWEFLGLIAKAILIAAQ